MMNHLKILKANVNKRKHYEQMSNLEVNSLKKRIERTKNWEYSGHAEERMEENEVKMTTKRLKKFMEKSKVIEYKVDRVRSEGKTFYDERVLVSCKKIILKNGEVFKLNVLLSITTNNVITVWLNRIGDNHKTLKWKAYTKEMQIPIF